MSQNLILKDKNRRWKNNAEEKIGKCGNLLSKEFI